MDRIEDIFTNDIYGSFCIYCREQGLQTMQDLIRRGLSGLEACPGMSPALLSRIRMLLTAYCKKHPDLARSRAAKPQPGRTAPVTAPETAQRLRAYFEEHADTLVRVADVTKALGLQRRQVVAALESAPWCKAVDAATYFYSPEE